MRPSMTHATLATACALALGACTSYVKKEDFDRTLGELRSEHAALKSQVDANRSAIESLRQSMEKRLADHDAKLTELTGRLHVDMNVHFAYDDATLREVDKPALDSFAKVIREHHPQASVTVEGFTDAAGDPTYNKQLGQRRAEAVKDHLLAAGLAADKLRAVSYGEAKDRQLSPGAWGDGGLANRRVTLVVDLPPAS
ncbi:OmpA family protein [Pseudomarimonas salicorniae]|uniref:OmpA family protein n=1 Tax=Pseudomarimonas salicorniae TaxID=2933270 RepID=A0ABT0GM60_9GAMM|nr:OmpA family protein [Lysobacter sp. CAU 1642]MCK7595457.1 OmpA family protein [Lysobacter sp. CAU 1642]